MSIGHILWYVFIHMTGIDTQTSRYYDFASGWGPKIVEIGVVVALFMRHHNCHVKGCWRLGHPDPEHNFPACKRHHSRRGRL